MAIEIVLWCCFLVPGIIYSLWRATSRYRACPCCKSRNLVPADSPGGQRLMKQFGVTEIPATPLSTTASNLLSVRSLTIGSVSIVFVLFVIGWLVMRRSEVAAHNANADKTEQRLQELKAKRAAGQ